jgi:phosphoglycerol transferase MdoB-like AlkP superfamily enzyme
MMEKATPRGFHESVLSRWLNPPVKWSFRKLILWWALLFLSIGWIVFYINTGTKNSSAVLSPLLILFSGLSAARFLLLLVLFWRHNQTTYKRRYSQRERSLLCPRCGSLTEQE